MTDARDPNSGDVAIRLLTGGDIRISAIPDLRWKGQLSAQLFALLALDAGRPVSRDKLAAALWPDAPDKTARRNLRSALHALRRLLGDEAESMLRADARTITLSVAPNSVDLVRIRRLGGSADSIDMAAALALYGGDLFGASPDPPEAIHQAREALRDRALETGLALLSDRRSESRQIRTWAAQRIVEIDPASEPAHCELMRAAAERGDRAGLLRQFQRLEVALEDQLDLSPSAETVGLRNQLAGARAVKDAGGPPALRSARGGQFAKLAPHRRILALATAFIGLVAVGGVVFTNFWGSGYKDIALSLHGFETDVTNCAVAGVTEELRHRMEGTLRAHADLTLRVSAESSAEKSIHLRPRVHCVGHELRAVMEIRRGEEILLFKRFEATTALAAELGRRMADDVLSEIRQFD